MPEALRLLLHNAGRDGLGRLEIGMPEVAGKENFNIRHRFPFASCVWKMFGHHMRQLKKSPSYWGGIILSTLTSAAKHPIF